MTIGNIDTMQNGLQISVDWLSFTIKDAIDWKSVATHFGLSEKQFQYDLNGSFGYKKRARHMLYSISILYDGNDGMGVHVDVSGSAIGYFLHSYLDKNTSAAVPFGGTAYEVESFEDTVLGDVLKDILDMGQITRLDLAIDDIGANYYTLPELYDIFENDLYVSRFKKYKTITQGGKGFCSGRSLYLGSRQSELMVRVYDKQLEQNSKKAGGVSVPWVRWEIELHKHRASAVALFLFAGKTLSEVSVGILSNYLRFIIKDKTRDSRCTTDPKWDRFLDGIEKLRICQPAHEKTIDDKREWLIKQVAPTLSAIYQIDGDLEFMYALIANGSARLSVELENIIRTSLCAVS